MYPTSLITVLLLTAVVSLACNDSTAASDGSELVGTGGHAAVRLPHARWTTSTACGVATQYVYKAFFDTTVTVDVVSLGGAFTLRLESSGTYTGTFREPGGQAQSERPDLEAGWVMGVGVKPTFPVPARVVPLSSTGRARALSASAAIRAASSPLPRLRPGSRARSSRARAVGVCRLPAGRFFVPSPCRAPRVWIAFDSPLIPGSAARYTGRYREVSTR